MQRCQLYLLPSRRHKKRDAAAKKEMEDLREALEHVSDSAKGLAKQRDDARAALARAKGTLRRMAPVRFWLSLTLLVVGWAGAWRNAGFKVFQNAGK